MDKYKFITENRTSTFTSKSSTTKTWPHNGRYNINNEYEIYLSLSIFLHEHKTNLKYLTARTMAKKYVSGCPCQNARCC